MTRDDFKQHVKLKGVLSKNIEMIMEATGEKLPSGKLRSAMDVYSRHRGMEAFSDAFHDAFGEVAVREIKASIRTLMNRVNSQRAIIAHRSEYKPVSTKKMETVYTAKRVADDIPKRNVRYNIGFVEHPNTNVSTSDIVIGPNWLRRVHANSIDTVADGSTTYFVRKAQRMQSAHLDDKGMMGWEVDAVSFKNKKIAHVRGYALTAGTDKKITAFGTTLNAAIRLLERRIVKAVTGAME